MLYQTIDSPPAREALVGAGMGHWGHMPQDCTISENCPLSVVGPGKKLWGEGKSQKISNWGLDIFIIFFNYNFYQIL